MISRRHVLATSAAALAMGSAAQAQTPDRLNVISHRVHQNVLTTGAGGDLTAPWTRRTGATVNWTTLDIVPLQDRLFREASLNETQVDVAFLLNSRATPRAATLLEPLDEHLAREPIEDWDDIFPGLRAAMVVGGKTIAVPFRHASNALFYNEQIMEERGITQKPRTMEELIEAALRCSYSRDGTPVTGFIIPGALTSMPVAFARAWDGDFITPDYRVIPNRAAMVKALSTFRTFFERGALPRTYTTTTIEDQVTALQQGRAVFTILPFARIGQLNDPAASRFPGKIKLMTMPMAQELTGRVPYAAIVEFWAMSIPKNARNKPFSWSFIREMSSRASTIGATLNGNGPVRASAYRDERVRQRLPTAAIEAETLATARVPFPAHENIARADAIFIEETQAAVLGRKPVEQAVDDAVRRITPLMTQ
jgi:multiple sugar transport system substrate-binding protein